MVKNMNPKTFAAAGRQTEIAPRKMSDLETIHKSNVAGRVVHPNGFYNRVFLSRDAQGQFKPVPEGIMRAMPLWSGTLAVIGPKGRPLGKRLEREAYYEGRRKTLIMETEGAPAEVMLCCNQGFGKGDIPNLQFFNAKTEKPIDTHEGMLEPSEVIMRLNGQTYAFSIQGRDGGILETVDGVNTFSWVADLAVGGLLWRGDDYLYNGRQGVGLVGLPSDRFGVAWEASGAGAPLETAHSKTQVVEKGGELIIKGAPEQLAAAKEALKGIQ